MSGQFRWVLALLSGLLLGLAFPPFSFPWLAWVAYVPLLVALRQCDWRTSAVHASSSHLLAYAISGHWVLLHTDPYTRAASATAMLWLALITALPWVAASANRRDDGTPSLLWLAGIFGVVEWCQIHTPIGFPWSALGNTQSEFEPFNQLAEFAGVTGISLWVIGINIGLHSLSRARAERRWIVATGVTVLVAVPAWIGSSRIERLSADETSQVDRIRVLAVQPSLALEHWMNAESSSRIDSLVDLTERAFSEPGQDQDNELLYDVVVWPETAIPPTDLTLPQPLIGLQNRVERWGVPLLSGAIEIVPGSEPGSPYRNSAFLLAPKVPTVRSYRKQRLVPFAEYVPFSQSLPLLNRLAVPSGGVWGYLPGVDDGLFDLGPNADAPIRLGVLICFESSFGYLSNRLARAGADILVVLTQDGWWGKSFGYQQHLAFNRLRAIETRLPLVQVSATGFSGLILPSGRVSSKMDWMVRGSSDWAVARRSVGQSLTPYTRYGDWPGLLCTLLTVFLILLAVVKRLQA